MCIFLLSNFFTFDCSWLEKFARKGKEQKESYPSLPFHFNHISFRWFHKMSFAVFFSFCLCLRSIHKKSGFDIFGIKGNILQYTKLLLFWIFALWSYYLMYGLIKKKNIRFKMRAAKFYFLHSRQRERTCLFIFLSKIFWWFEKNKNSNFKKMTKKYHQINP